MSYIMSDRWKLELVSKIGEDYNSMLHKMDVLQAAGIKQEQIAKLLGIDRRSVIRFVNHSRKRNNQFFKHIAFVSLVNNMYGDMPEKIRKRSEHKLEKRKREKISVNRKVYRPETDKNLSSD